MDLKSLIPMPVIFRSNSLENKNIRFWTINCLKHNLTNIFPKQPKENFLKKQAHSVKNMRKSCLLWKDQDKFNVKAQTSWSSLMKS